MLILTGYLCVYFEAFGLGFFGVCICAYGVVAFSFNNSLCTGDINPLLDLWFAFFSYSVEGIFFLLIVLLI